MLRNIIQFKIVNGRGGSCIQYQSCDRVGGWHQPLLQDCFVSSPDQPQPATSGLTTTAALDGSMLSSMSSLMRCQARLMSLKLCALEPPPHIYLAKAHQTVLGYPSRIIPVRSSIWSTYSVAVARAMANQVPCSAGGRLVHGS